MPPLEKRITQLQKDIAAAMVTLQTEQKKQDIAHIETELSHPEVWNNPSRAQDLSRKLSALQGVVEPWQILESQVRDIGELLELSDGDTVLQQEFEHQVALFEREFLERKTELLYGGQYDQSAAIVRLSAGVGGTDAQDFCEMLERMYLRWAERSDMHCQIVERSAGEQAGVKTSVLEVSGPYAYGKLRAENGVHRLVRLSPFNSDNLRQTSFALVEVLPEITQDEQSDIPEKDLKIDVYRAGGHGGQSVNTTDSAVRVTHVPTGIVVAIQNERSQLQNKETALKILRAKLAQLSLEQHEKNLERIKGPSKSAEWGAQIRNYVLHPYTLAKDTRTGFEDRDVKSVLDGKIDAFMRQFLEWESLRES